MFKVSDYLSLKIKRVSFLMALLVVAHHSYFGEGTAWQCFFDGVCNNSVPYFFVLSGFLMFKGYDGSWAWMKHAWISRARTLAVPYFFWMLVGTVLMLVLYRYGRWDSELQLRSVSWWIHALGLSNAPFGNRYLWFVRRLIIFALWAPVIGLIIRKTGLLVSAGALFVFAVLGKSADVWQSLSFFSAGIWMSMRYKGVYTKSSKELLPIESLLVITLTVAAFHTVFGMGTANMIFDRLARYLLAWAWIALIWHGYDTFQWGGALDRWTGSAFFVYCFHGLLWRLVRTAHIPLTSVTCWFVIAGIATLSVGSWWILSRKCAKLYAWISGGRGAK